MKLFLVEDDIDDQELLEEALTSLDAEIQLVTFPTGKNAISFLETVAVEDFPLAIIIDYNMPGMDGVDVLQHLQDERFKNIIKIVWSTSDSAAYRNTCLSHGASFYFVKPPSMTGLHDMLR